MCLSHPVAAEDLGQRASPLTPLKVGMRSPISKKSMYDENKRLQLNVISSQHSW